MTIGVLPGLLKAQAEGKVMWLAVRGWSMHPILRGGESLKVIRCSEAALRPGEIAVMLGPGETLIAHLVVSTNPLRTESFTGTPDSGPLEVLARTLAVRRGALVFPLIAPLRPALLVLQRSWALAAHSTPTRIAWRLLGDVLASERTGRLRTLLAPVEIQILGPETFRELGVLLSRWVRLSGIALEGLLRTAVAVGALQRDRLVGCAFVCPDRVLRYGFVQRRAQGLGAEVAMVERVLREAESKGMKVERADLHPLQKGFLTAAATFGIPSQERS